MRTRDKVPPSWVMDCKRRKAGRENWLGFTIRQRDMRRAVCIGEHCEGCLGIMAYFVLFWLEIVWSKFNFKSKSASSLTLVKGQLLALLRFQTFALLALYQGLN